MGDGAITREMLSQEVLAQLDANATASPSTPITITRDMLPQDVRDDINATIGLNRLSPEVSSALKPVILEQPVSVVSVEGLGTSLVVDAAGGNVTYQWKRDGANLTGATSRILTISDLNESQHDGNYSVIVSNAFGSTTSAVVGVDINGSLAKGLVGWWKFDETNGNTAYDSSGNGNDCNLSNGPTWIDGKINGALSFDGVNDYGGINLSDIFDPSSFTVSCWVFFQSTNSQMILNKGADVALNFRLYIDTSKNYVFDTFSPRLLHDKIGKVELSDWVFFTLHVNDLHQMFYKNGVVMQHGYRTSNVFKDSSLLQIGAKLSPIDKFGDFIIDDLRIYDRSLSAFEVKSLYELGEKQDSNASAGTPLVQAEVADGSVTASKIASKTIGKDQISDEILKYLKPEITAQPHWQTPFMRTAMSRCPSPPKENTSLTNGQKMDSNLAGETNCHPHNITDANATQHDGNYSVVVSNDFGSTETNAFEFSVINQNAISQGLVAWYPFDGNASDMSGDGNHGTVNGATLGADRHGVGSKAYNFDGVNDWIDFNTVSFGGTLERQNDYSISFWLKLAYSNNWGRVFNNYSNSNPCFIIGSVGSGSHNFFVRDTSGIYEVIGFGDKVDDMNWQHLAVQKNGNVFSSFLNSEFFESKTFSGSDYINSETFKLAKTPHGGDFIFVNCSIDDVRIYDRALSAAEVQALYNLGQ